MSEHRLPSTERSDHGARSVSAGHGWTWITRGFALFRKSPSTWLALILILFAATKLLALIPVLGIVFVLLMPVFIVGLMEGCRALEHGEPLQLAHLACGFRKNAAQLVTIGGVSLVGNLAVMMIVLSLGGEAMSVLAKTLSQGAPATAPSPSRVGPPPRRRSRAARRARSCRCRS